MKIFSQALALAFLSIVFSATAQVEVSSPKASFLVGSPNFTTPTASFNPTPTSLQQGMSSILFYEDFANGFAGNNGIGAWTAGDTGSGLLWQAVDAAGDGYYYNGMPSGVHPPAGEFSTQAGTLASTTATNGWMAFDCDFYNTPISNGYENTEGWITSPSLNFEDVGSVIISWEQYFRYCCYPFAPIFLQVSSDGGAIWTTFDAHGAFIESANTASANPLPTSVDISCAAAFQSNVLIRFSYLQPVETGDGYSHYYWGIDDVTIFENTAMNDLEAVQLTNADISNLYEYRITPMEQVTSSSDGGLVVGLMYRNNGVADQEAEVQVEVLNSEGTVVHTIQEDIGLVSAPANSALCPPNFQDTVYVQTGWTPLTTGTFTIRATISPTTASDITPENNVISKTIIFTDYEIGHDEEEVLNYEFTPRESDVEGLFDPCGYGSFFRMNNEGSTAYGVAVRFGANSGGGSLEFETRLYTRDESLGLTDSPFETTYWEYDDSWTPDSLGNGEFVYLPFDEPIELTNENVYFACVINEFQSEYQLTVLGNANSDTDNSTGNFSQAGSGDFVWFSAQTATPAIRLVLSPVPFALPGCTDATAWNYNPGAIEDDGSCVYEMSFECEGASDIFISEYVEGTGNNKAIEFFNPTNTPIDLEPYVLQRWSNGQANMTDATDLVGIIPALGTWVLVNGQTEDIDLGGGATSPMCSPELQALANQLDNPYPAPTFFNGDDALVLLKNENIVVDIFGKPGEDPGAAWTDDADNGFIDVGNGANLLTSNHTLRRKPNVSSGVTSPPVAFDANAEWEIHDSDNWTDLGFHTFDCEISGCLIEDACNYFPQSTMHEPTACDYSCHLCDEAFDFGESTWGYSPNPAEGETFQSGVLGQYYFDTFSMRVPINSTEIDPTFQEPIDSVVVVDAVAQSISTMETFNLAELGLHLNCSQNAPYSSNCNVIGGEDGCFAIVGEPLMSGHYEITFTLQGWYTLSGMAVPQPYPTDGIPIFIAEEGCTDPQACNYNPNANQENGICTYPGCLDPSASNYDALAGCAAECIYSSFDCSSLGDDVWSNEPMGIFPDWQWAMHGVEWEGEWVFNVPTSIIEEGTGVTYGIHHIAWNGLEGLPDWATAATLDTSQESGAGTQFCISAFGIPTAPGTHTITATAEVFISVFGQPFSIGEQSFFTTLEVMSNPNPIPGCMYPLANNYLPYATMDDGSCEYWGCTDAENVNFNPFANVDDGSCGEACDSGSGSTCQADNNGDGAITVADLLILLGEFGAECE